jgi:SagB-type dehydrogenase family enzyme
MRLGPISLSNVLNAPADTHGERMDLYQVLERLAPLIVRSLAQESGHPLLSVVPLTMNSQFRPVPLAAGIPVRMSAYATLRTDGSEYTIESPQSLQRVILHRAEAMSLIAPLAGPVTPAAFRSVLASVGPADDVLEYLAAAGMVTCLGRSGDFDEDADPALLGWSPVDLMFHARSTLGRHDNDFGLTYPAGRPTDAEPVVKLSGGESIALSRPDWDDLHASDPRLTVAMEARRSVRNYTGDLLTAAQLGELLYRSARVRSLAQAVPGVQGPPDAPTAGAEFSDRPYPSGGASFELELYVSVAHCTGLARGVYHYDPLRHRLERVDGDPDAGEELLGAARRVGGLNGAPQVLISMTARFPRVSWRYEGNAYRLVLIHVGVLMQNLYLVCTAMGLAPCALDAHSIEVAARAFGTDWRVEPCVGQFLVGGRAGVTDDVARWRHDVNDARWADFARGHEGLSNIALCWP